MADRFIGRYEHSLDIKGRVFLPAKFRLPFQQSGGYLSEHHEGCLALWTPDEFEEQMQRMHSSAALGAQERNMSRLWASASHQVEVDRQGRLAIPGYLREFAELTTEAGAVLVVGAIDRVELWNMEIWKTKVKPYERHLVEGGLSASSV